MENTNISLCPSSNTIDVNDVERFSFAMILFVFYTNFKSRFFYIQNLKKQVLLVLRLLLFIIGLKFEYSINNSVSLRLEIETKSWACKTLLPAFGAKILFSHLLPVKNTIINVNFTFRVLIYCCANFIYVYEYFPS